MAESKTKNQGQAYKFCDAERGLALKTFRLAGGGTHIGTMDSGFAVGSPVGEATGNQGTCESIVAYSFGVIVTVATGESRFRILVNAAGQGLMVEP